MAIKARLPAFLLFLVLPVSGVVAKVNITLSPRVERQVSPPTPITAQPSDADEKAMLARFSAFADALQRRDFGAAYAMLRLSMQADTPRLEWEMNRRKRGGLWVDGAVKILRISWYPDPAGQPPGLYAALDFRGDRADGSMDCGYLVLHRPAPGADFSIVRTDTTAVPANLMEEGVPKVDVLHQLPCYLGPGIATDF